MNGLEILNTTPSAALTGQAVTARADDTAPDDAGGDASRSFKALLDTFAEPCATPDGSAHPAAPGFAPPPSAVLRQALQFTSEVNPGNAAEGVELPAQAADGARTDKKTPDDLALTDLAGDPPPPVAASQPDAAPSVQGVAPWSAAVSGAVGLMMPTLAGPALPASISFRQPSDTASRGGQQSVAANAEVADGLSADVGRLLDAAAGATDAVLSDGAAQPGIDRVLSANVTVLRTETHLPPVTPTSPLHQIVNAITADGLAAAKGEPAAAGASETALSAGPERQLVRTLDIRLEPPDLGSVTVKLRLSGQHLALRISADTAGTAQSLEQDRDTLLSLLRGNGYTPEISAVRHEPAAAIPTHTGTDATASSQGAGNQSAGQGETDGGARSQSGQPGGQQQSRPGFAAGFEFTDGHDADVQDIAARSGVYL